jgi:hypothetical protein
VFCEHTWREKNNLLRDVSETPVMFLYSPVQNNSFFCTEDCIVLYKRNHSSVQGYNKVSPAFLKRPVALCK